MAVGDVTLELMRKRRKHGDGAGLFTLHVHMEKIAMSPSQDMYDIRSSLIIICNKQ